MDVIKAAQVMVRRMLTAATLIFLTVDRKASSFLVPLSLSMFLQKSCIYVFFFYSYFSIVIMNVKFFFISNLAILQSFLWL